MDLIIASNNKGKIDEYKKILEPFGFNVYSQREKNINIEVDEIGTTFEENAYLKAKSIYDITQNYVISDDSGLEVEELNNAPGIYSARYKDLETESERRKEILKELKGKENRKARFITVICFIDENGKHTLFKGIWNGKIAFNERGKSGFGYDPIFESEDGDGKTTAELGIDFKNKYSHRSKATKQLIEYLKKNK